jgi:hypothetical protein
MRDAWSAFLAARKDFQSGCEAMLDGDSVIPRFGWQDRIEDGWGLYSTNS